MELIIRKARREDLPKMLEIQKRAFLVQAVKYNAYDIPPMVEEENEIDLQNADLTVLVAEMNGEIAGSIRLLRDGNSAEIKRLSVADKFQNMGIGRTLMCEIENYTDGLDRLWLFTGGQSEKNISLYKKLGFRAFREEPFKEKFTLIYMEKSI
jgi:ribosomal protein S18 acetylase RimI-like enzyme